MKEKFLGIPSKIRIVKHLILAAANEVFQISCGNKREMSSKSGFTENDNLGFAANLNIIILYNFLETFEYEEPSRTEKETKYYLFKGFSTRLDALCI